MRWTETGNVPDIYVIRGLITKELPDYVTNNGSVVEGTRVTGNPPGLVPVIK